MEKPSSGAPPQGIPTRGKTAQNRLRRSDIFITRYTANLVKAPSPPGKIAWFVDLGYGRQPFTTLESAERLRKLNPALPVLGVEIDPERVEAALPYQDTHTHFRLGGFNLPLKQNENARIIRAFNVLRQYDEEQVHDSLLTLAERLQPGGIILEGTSDPYGRIWVANLLKKQENGKLILEGLIFSTNFRWGFEPAMFQPVLPKNLIHRMVEGEPIEAFFSAWEQTAKQTIAHKEFGLRQWFIAAAQELPEHGYEIDLRKKMLKSGFLVWKNPNLTF